MRRRAAERGYTLLEVMIVGAIAVGLLAMGAVGVRRLRHSDLRTASARLAGAIKYTYDRSVTTGKYYRLVIDLDSRTFAPQVSDDRFYLVRGQKQSEEEERREEQEAAGARQAAAGAVPAGTMAAPGGLAGSTRAKVGLGRARFSTEMPPDKKRSGPLQGVTVAAVWTPRTEEPVTSGRAYLYFFPQGMTERAIIHLSDPSGQVYSLLVHPLTGRVKIVAERVEPPRSAEDVDDAGEARP